MINLEQILKHDDNITVENDEISNFIVLNSNIENVCLEHCKMLNGSIKESKLSSFFWNEGKVEKSIFEKCLFEECCMKNTIFKNDVFNSCKFLQEEQEFCAEFIDTEFSNVIMENQGIRYSVFKNCKLNKFGMIRGILGTCKLSDCIIEGLVFDQTAMWGDIIEQCNITNSELKMAGFRGVEISKSTLRNNIFDKYTFRKCILKNVNWINNKGETIVFENVKFINVDMTASRFKDTSFRNCEFDCIIVEEASYINVEFQNCKMQCIDFTSSKKIEKILFENCEMGDIYFSDEQIESYTIR